MECNGYTSINRNSQGNDLVSTSPAVPRSEVLKLVQLVFVVLMSAMQDDPANKMFFETNVSISLFPPLFPFFFLLSLYLFYIQVSPLLSLLLLLSYTLGCTLTVTGCMLYTS